MFVLVPLSPSGKAGLLLRSETAAATDLVGDDSIHPAAPAALFIYEVSDSEGGRKEKKEGRLVGSRRGRRQNAATEFDIRKVHPRFFCHRLQRKMRGWDVKEKLAKGVST